MQGNLSQIAFGDLLLLATSGKKSGVLKLVRGKENVEIFLVDGNIVHAHCPVGDGEKAVLYPVTWSEGTFQLTANGEAPKSTIAKTPAELLDEVKDMTREWEAILKVVPSAKAVFRLADLREDPSAPVTVPSVAWRVLAKLDGARTVQEVADSLRIPFAYAAKVIYSLHKVGLVEAVPLRAQAASEVVSPALLERLTNILIDVIGPMAPLVLRDQIEALAESEESFPEAKLDALLASVGAEISDPTLRSRFEKAASQEIANFKRL